LIHHSLFLLQNNKDRIASGIGECVCVCVCVCVKTETIHKRW